MRFDIMKRMISFLLAMILLFSCVPVNAFAAGTESTQEPETNPSFMTGFEGKTVSVLGDSISTYTGVSNNTGCNATIGSNAVYYTEGRHGVYANDTWWMQVANDLGLRLLVNNSWSGSSLLYTRNGTVGAYVERCVQLHDDTGDNAGETPDIIGIQMGYQ